MSGRLHPKDEALLRRLQKDHPRAQWFTGDTKRSVERLIAIGLIQRTRDGVVITPAGIVYCMLTDQVAIMKNDFSQTSLFGGPETGKSNQIQQSLWK